MTIVAQKFVASSSLLTRVQETIGTENVLPQLGSRVAIAMSGGVDSSVVAALLSGLGYEVVGITAWLLEGAGKCCNGGMIDAARVCESIGIEHLSLDLREFFASNIINPFLRSYAGGMTPVPCMPCNTLVKWGSLLNHVQGLGFSHLASGHYARLILQGDRYVIGKANDENKDQSYMLWGLNQDQLARTCFPLANFCKQQVRALACELGLPTADKEESMDICFTPQGNREFLIQHLGQAPGEIRSHTTGELLGQHQGVHLFTVGQRKGIGLANSSPLYVIKIDATKNVVYVGERHELASGRLIARRANWQSILDSSIIEGQLKIRYNSPPAMATVELLSEDEFQAEFMVPQLSVCPGQAAVLYDSAGRYIIGGGWITEETTAQASSSGTNN